MTAERIVLLGAGRLATHLSRALKVYAPERKIVQIYSPGGHSARRLAESLGGDVEVAVCRTIEFVHTARHLYIAPEALGKPSSRMPSRAIDLHDLALRGIDLQRTR